MTVAASPASIRPSHRGTRRGWARPAQSPPPAASPPPAPARRRRCCRSRADRARWPRRWRRHVLDVIKDQTPAPLPTKELALADRLDHLAALRAQARARAVEAAVAEHHALGPAAPVTALPCRGWPRASSAPTPGGVRVDQVILGLTGPPCARPASPRSSGRRSASPRPPGRASRSSMASVRSRFVSAKVRSKWRRSRSPDRAMSYARSPPAPPAPPRRRPAPRPARGHRWGRAEVEDGVSFDSLRVVPPPRVRARPASERAAFRVLRSRLRPGSSWLLLSSFLPVRRDRKPGCDSRAS